MTSAPPALSAYAFAIEAVTAERLGASYRAGCPVAPERLRLVRVTHLSFEGTAATGELVVAANVAEDVAAAFGELYAQRFPIAGMVTVEPFGADDDASMAADNTSAFNCRPITGGGGWSLHSYGSPSTSTRGRTRTSPDPWSSRRRARPTSTAVHRYPA